ncbi:MAG: dihydrodipicolinate reductase C-terminal domain-containing protein [Baekduia sp.]
MIRVGVSGAAGKVGQAICAGVDAADDLELVGRADPSLGATLEEILPACEVVVDFTTPATGQQNVLACMNAGVHCVFGTTGFELDPLRTAGPGKAFFAPNFAIGAVLMMRFAAEASRHMKKAEIIELHHDTKLDAPSGTARHTAELMEGDVPIHSVRLPGLVAHQEVLLGDQGQTLTIRHDSTDRTSFVPGVLLAVRKVADQDEPLIVGLDRLLWPE